MNTTIIIIILVALVAVGVLVLAYALCVTSKRSDEQMQDATPTEWMEADHD